MPSGDATTIFVLGASGDLARKKTYPSLYELFLAGLLPARVTILGYARSSLTDAAAREGLAGHLKAGTPEQRSQFLALCIYRSGGYDDVEAFRKVALEAEALETKLSETGIANRLFYFAIPPSVFVVSAASVHGGGMVRSSWRPR